MKRQRILTIFFVLIVIGMGNMGINSYEASALSSISSLSKEISINSIAIYEEYVRPGDELVLFLNLHLKLNNN